MNNQKFNNETLQILKRIPLLLIICAFGSTTLLTACASTNRKDEAVSAILEKENVLIEKLKVERAQPEIVRAVLADPTLSKAELHLSMSLEEILKANTTIRKKIIKQSKKEESNGQN